MQVTEKIITVDELIVKVVKKKVKNIYLSILPPDGTVRISAPLRTKDDVLHSFVISKLSWIRKKIALFQNQKEDCKFIAGENHYYLGQKYILDISYCKKPYFIELQEGYKLVMYIDENIGFEERKKLFYSWYKKEMERMLPAIVEKWETKSELQVKFFGIRRMKTKWGSCNITRKRIWLNTELIKKPIECLEYVVVHEIVHLLERRHNNKFKSHLDRIMPGWRTLHRKLNNRN